MGFKRIINVEFHSILLISLVSGTLADSGPYLSHQGTRQDSAGQFMALITSELINFRFKECSLVIWKSADPISAISLDNYVNQFALHFTSIQLFQNDSLTESSLPVLTSKLHELCSVVVYLNLNYFQGSQIFPHNWFSSLPGGYGRSYHIIFYNILNQKLKDFMLAKLPHPLEKMIHRIFISISKQEMGHQCTLWECNIFGEVCTRVQLYQAKRAFSNNKLDLKGASLIWATVTMPGISRKAMENFIKYRKDINVFITPYVQISEALNATPVLNQVSSQNFGTLGKSGKWEGAVGEIVYGRAHITQGLVTKDRYEAVFLSKTIDTDGLTFTTGLAMTSPGSPFFLIESYDWTTWTALLIIIILLVLVSMGINKQYFDTNKKSRLHFAEVIIFVIGPLLDQPEDTRKYRRFIKRLQSRLLFGPWLLSLVVWGTMYKTSIISTLTSPTVNNPPTNFKDLLESDYRSNFLGISVTAGTVYKDLKAKGNLLVNELDKRIVAYYDPANGEACVAQTNGKRFACLGIRTMLLEFVNRYLTKQTGEPLFRVARDYLYTSFYTFCISKNLPHLLPDVDRMMYHYAESGSYGLFRRNVERDAQKVGKMIAKRRNKTNPNHHNKVMESTKNSWNHNELDNTLRSMIVLGMGLGMSTIVLGLELLSQYLSRCV